MVLLVVDVMRREKSGVMLLVLRMLVDGDAGRRSQVKSWMMGEERILGEEREDMLFFGGSRVLSCFFDVRKKKFER